MLRRVLRALNHLLNRTRPLATRRTPWRANLTLECLEARDCPAATWDGGGTDNLWSNAQNWDDNVVPAATATVTFDAGAKNATMDVAYAQPLAGLVVTGTYTGKITFSHDIQIMALTLDTATIAGSATVSIAPMGSFRWTGGTIGDSDHGSLVISHGATGSIRSQNQMQAFSGTINGWAVSNSGRLNWNNDGGVIAIQNGGLLENDALGEFDIFGFSGGTANFTISGGNNETNRLVNFGNIGVSADELTLAVRVNSMGNWDIILDDKGSLTFDAVICCGTWNVRGSTQLILNPANNRSVVLEDCTFSGTGKVIIDGAVGGSTQTTINGNVVVGNILQKYGTINGAGTLRVVGEFEFRGGNWTDFGLIEIEQGGKLLWKYNADGGPVEVRRKIVNNGTIEVGSNTPHSFADGADIVNAAGGVINLTLAGVYWEATGANRARIENSGTINVNLAPQSYLRKFKYEGNGQLNVKKGKVEFSSRKSFQAERSFLRALNWQPRDHSP